MKHKSLVIANPKEWLFGKAPKPVKTRRGPVIGGGKVYSEPNFTLPTITINDSTQPEKKGLFPKYALPRTNGIPDGEGDFIERMMPLPDTGKFIPSEYGL
jgi:hypothetical protein